MDSQCPVEVALCCAHSHGNPDQLDHLACPVAQNMDPKHAICRPVHENFHHHALGASRKRGMHGTKARFEQNDIVSVPGFFFSQANRADLRR